MKKIKGHKCSPSHPSHPSHQTRPVGLAVMCEHWTPEGDSKVTDHKESQFYERYPFKKFSPSMLYIEIPSKLKNKIAFNFIKEIPLKISTFNFI